MNVSKILRRILLEDDNIRGIDYNDQYDILKRGIEKCPSMAFLKDRSIKALKDAEIKPFIDIPKTLTSVAYVTALPTSKNDAYVFFGIEDPKKTSSEKQFLAYKIFGDGKTLPQRVPDGWGLGCPEFQTRFEVNVDELTDIQKADLEDFISNNSTNYTRYPDPGQQDEYNRVNYADLVYPESSPRAGQKVLPDYKGSGYIYQRRGLTNRYDDIFGGTSELLNKQGFTRDVSTLAIDSPERNMELLLVDLANDYPALKDVATKSPNTKVWPMAGTLIKPEREKCRDIVKHLHRCWKKNSNSSECLNMLWKNKVLAYQCDVEKNFLGGILGIQNELDDLKTDFGQYGLANLIKARERSKETNDSSSDDLKESIRNKVSRFLNEEYKRRNFR